jgi:hypothetical protein
MLTPNVAVSDRWTRERARTDDWPLHPLDGRREASAPSAELTRARRHQRCAAPRVGSSDLLCALQTRFQSKL